jgi:hypothetical protein
MSPIVDDKKYSTDTLPYGPTVVAEGFVDHFDESPISRHLQMKDICIYKPGVAKPGVTLTPENFQDPTIYDVLPDQNKNGKWGKTSWDSFSYALLMGHNVWMHLESVQRANRDYDTGTWPKMMWNENGDHARFKDIVDAIFSAPDRDSAEAIIEHYNRYWMDIVGTRGFKGKKTVNARTQFTALFSFDKTEVDTDQDDSVQLDTTALDQLEQEQQ